MGVKILAYVGLTVAIIGVVVGLSALTGWAFWAAWEYVAVPVFGAPVMTFYQAWALFFLFSMVLGAARGKQ